jgi:SAM-dependent methyltransferase
MLQSIMGRPAHGNILSRHLFVAAALAAVFAFAVPSAGAQEVTPEIENRSDQLDVPFVPSTNAVLDAMFEFAKPTKDDYVMDLGSGDGRIVNYAASKFGASGHGIDLNEGLVKIANARAKSAGVADRAKFYVRDLFKEDISKASIVTMYLLPEVVLQLRPKLFSDLKPGSRIVSHDYHMGDWRFDDAKVVGSRTGGEEDIVYYWKVPAKVAGIWDWKVEFAPYFQGLREYKALISQRWQDIEGRVDTGVLPMRMHDAKLDGTRISFSVTGEVEERVVRHDFVGTVNGNRIEGTATLRGSVEAKTYPWSAYRTKADN